MNTKRYEIDMTSGPIIGKMLLFSLPLMASGILNLLFNAVDIIVVGKFTGNAALAAVGSTTSLINVFITLFIGISLGANILVAKSFAIGRDNETSETVHTAILLAIIFGVVMLFVGQILSRPLLTLMNTPTDIIDQAVLYIRIYFLGMPFFMLYTFGSAILRAVGDTRRPLYFLIVAGLANVCLNLVLVIVFHLGVAGVAIGTVTSQFISSSLILFCMSRTDASYKLMMSKLRINKNIAINILKLGIPAGIQSMLINVSNALIQSSVNSFGTLAVAGNTAANNLNGFLYMVVNAITQGCLSFTSQNMGARNYKRVDKILASCLFLEVVFGTVMGVSLRFLGPAILSIYSSDANVISYGMINVVIICTPYALCGLLDCIPGSVRGMGHSLAPMFIGICGIVLFRFFWIYVVFPQFHTLEALYISYPISWIITSFAHFMCFLIMRKKNYTT